jgi:hypothetical protein
MFVAWLIHTDLLVGLWEGDSPPGSPNLELYAEASSVADQVFYWDSDSEPKEGADEDDDGDEEGAKDVRWEKLQLHLPAELVDQIRHPRSRRSG